MPTGADVSLARDASPSRACCRLCSSAASMSVAMFLAVIAEGMRMKGVCCATVGSSNCAPRSIGSSSRQHQDLRSLSMLRSPLLSPRDILLFIRVAYSPCSHALRCASFKCQVFWPLQVQRKVEGKVCRWRRRESDRAKCISRLIWRLSARPLHVPAVTSAFKILITTVVPVKYTKSVLTRPGDTRAAQCPRPVLFSLRCGSLF